MEWWPAPSAAVVNEAPPPDTDSVSSVVVPSSKLMVPAPPLGRPVAVKVTDCPTTEGLADEVRVKTGLGAARVAPDVPNTRDRPVMTVTAARNARLPFRLANIYQLLLLTRD